MPQEIEIRLAARPDDLARLAHGALLRRLGQGRAATRRLNSVYYDTPGLDLARTGISLRVRKTGRAYVQTVKDSNSGSLASQRGEWESPLPTPQPDLRFIPDPVMRERLIALAGDAPVEPKLETDILRTTRRLRTEAGDEIELAIDRGEIRTLAEDKAPLSVAEVELELKSGSPAALYEIARELSESAPFTVTTESKAERGMRAIEGRGHAPYKAGRMGLRPDATAEDAFRATLMHCLRHIAQNAPAVGEARDVEGLHQLRVGLRRLRAAFSAFGPAFQGSRLDDLRERAKKLAGEFAETRDLDVLAIELLPLVEEAAQGRAGLAELRRRLDAMRDQSWEGCAALAGSKGFTGFLLDLAAAAETRAWREDATPEMIAAFARPASELARESLGRRERKARKRARNLSSLSNEERHALRIALKKLRYGAEFFAPLFPAKDVSAYLKKLSEAQDVFGALNDAATVGHILERILKEARPAGADALREGAAFVEGWHLGRIEPAWTNARKRWKRLAKAQPFWAWRV